MTPLDAALDYAERGLPVIPVQPGTKIPAITRWTERATLDPTTIRRWWNQHPDAGVGIATGHPHPAGGYLTVIDPDEHDPAQSGAEALHDLEAELGALPDTYTVHTPTGGRHIYTRTPQPISNGAATHLPPGIDIRGRGGYVLAPPSEHPNGGTYQADLDTGIDNIAEIPAAWVEHITRTPEPAKPTATPKPANTGTWANAPRPNTDRPGDIYNTSTTWRQLLETDGWRHLGTGGAGEEQYERPGQPDRGKVGATVNYGDADLLKVFTSSVPGLTPEQTYSRFGYYAATRHNGDHQAASNHLRTIGYGTPAPTSSTPTPPPVEHAAADPDEAWPDPIPLHDGERPPFPTHVLPDWIAAQVNQAAEEMQLTGDLAAQLAITALTIVTAGRVQIRINGRWTEWTNTYTVTALPPSAGKSPTFGMMLGALERWEENLVDTAEAAIDEREIERRVLEKERDDAIKRGEPTQAKAAADALRDLPELHTPRLMADDATPEKLVDILEQQQGRLALVSTEGGLFGMMLGRYKKKDSAANLDVYLGAWSGDTIRVDRVERGTVIVRRPRLTIGLTVQPDVIARLGKEPELVGRGVTARFMYAVPADTVGQRDKRRDSTYSAAIEDTYADRLLGLAARLDRHNDQPLTLELSADARRRFLDWQADREEQLGPHSPLRYMAEWVTKCDSTVARLAGLLHVANGNLDPVIDLHTIDQAITIGNYWTEHARAAFDLMGASDETGHARYLLGWLEHRAAPDVTFRDLHQHAKKRVTKAADLVPAVELLIDYGWLRPAFDGPLLAHIGRGGKSPTLHVHPSLTIPHLPHCPTDSDHTATDSAEVREVREVSPKGPSEHNFPHLADKDERPPKPDLTSLTTPNAGHPLEADPIETLANPNPFGL